MAFASSPTLFLQPSVLVQMSCLSGVLKRKSSGENTGTIFQHDPCAARTVLRRFVDVRFFFRLPSSACRISALGFPAHAHGRKSKRARHAGLGVLLPVMLECRIRPCTTRDQRCRITCRHHTHLTPLGWCSTLAVVSEQPQVVSVTTMVEWGGPWAHSHMGARCLLQRRPSFFRGPGVVPSTPPIPCHEPGPHTRRRHLPHASAASAWPLPLPPDTG